jgi:hypothetical protein
MNPKEDVEKQIQRLIDVARVLQKKAENAPGWFEAQKISQAIAQEAYRLEKFATIR